MKKPPDQAGRDAISAFSIGAKLKMLRMEKGLTLARVGSETRLSTALLSKLESERMIPTLHTLAKICRVYGVDLTYFFSSVERHSLAITRGAHIKDQRRDQPSAKRLPLHHVSSESRLVSNIIEIPADVALNVSEAGIRTELSGYIIEGTLHMTIAGIVDILQTGDCFVLDSDATIMWTAPNSLCRIFVTSAK